MSDKELIKSAFEAKNIKLVKVLLDNSNLDDLLSTSYSWGCSLRDLGAFNNAAGFNFLLNYFYQKKRVNIVKKFFGDSSKLSDAAAFLNRKNYKRLRKITHKNWWILKDHSCLKEAIRHNNLFMVEALIQLYKSYNYDFQFVIPNLHYCIESNFNDEFRNKNQDFRVLKLLNKEYDRIPQILINHLFSANNKDLIKVKLQRIIEIFRLKKIDYYESHILKSLDNKDLFFYLYKNTPKTQKSQFFSLGYYSNMISLLERKLHDSYCKIDKEVALFLLKNNLKIISKAN